MAARLTNTTDLADHPARALAVAWAGQLRHDRRRSEHTIRAYLATAHRLIDFLGSHRAAAIDVAALKRIEAAELRAFLAARRGDGLGSSSAARELSALRGFLAFVAFFVILAVWEVGCRAFNVPTYLFPTPSATIASLFEFAGAIGQHAWKTFWTTMVGFAIGVVVGVLLGFLIGSSRFMYNALYPLMVGFNAIPKSAFVPIFVVWFGLGTVPAITTAFVISFFPITVNVATGLATLEPEMEDVLRALGASRLDVLLKVGLPRSLPYFFASLKVAITLAFVGTVISEMSASNDGIGNLMMSATGQMRTGLMFAGLVVISAMAMLAYVAFAWLERRMTGWATRGMNAS